MIKVRCEKCGKMLIEPGALIFSPLIDGSVLKFHICKHCYSLLCNWMEDEDEG